MKLKIVLALLLFSGLLVPMTQAAPLSQQETDITVFETDTESVSRATLASNTARIPVTWEVINRPANANLVFEQVFGDGSVQNIELPRSFTLIPSSGTGLVAPRNTSGDEIQIQVRLVDINSNVAYVQKQITIPIMDPPFVEPSIVSFTVGRTSISRSDLSLGLLIPVSWAVQDAVPNMNVVFEQVLADGRVINVELPRDILIIPPSGNGVVLPGLPGGDSDEVVLQMRVVDLQQPARVDGGVFDTSQITIDITDETGPITPQIDSFTVNTTAIARDELTRGGLRVPVSWSVSHRPPSTNLVFEQVFPDGTFQNIELPRSFSIIPSSGSGVVAPQSPGGDVDEIVFRLRIMDLQFPTRVDDGVFASEETTVGITGEVTSGEAEIQTFVSTGAAVSRSALNAGTLRVPVTWTVNNRPPNSNLAFEQVLPDGSTPNVELPRLVPVIPSSGNGIVAPQSVGDDIDEIVIRLRVFDLNAPSRSYASRVISINISDDVAADDPRIDQFSSGTTAVERGQLTAGTARVPVTWAVSNRPSNSNLVFEQVFADGSILNVELPRLVPIVPSSGQGVVAPVLRGDMSEVLVRLRVVDLSSGQTLASRDITFSIVGAPTSGPPTVSQGGVCFNPPYQPTNGIGNAATGTVTSSSPIPILSAPASDALLGELDPGASFTVLEGGPSCYETTAAVDRPIELRLWPIRTESGLEGWVEEYNQTGLGITYLVAPSGSDGALLVSECLVSPYAPDQGVRVGSDVQVTASAPSDGLSITPVNASGPIPETELDQLKPGGTLTVIGGPVCNDDGGTLVGAARQWRVQTASGGLEGWIYEHTNISGNVTQYLIPLN